MRLFVLFNMISWAILCTFNPIQIVINEKKECGVYMY